MRYENEQGIEIPMPDWATWTSVGVREVEADGAIEVVMMCRPLTPAELEAESKPSEIMEVKLALAELGAMVAGGAAR